MGMLNFKEDEMNEEKEDIIGRVLHFLESEKVNKIINIFGVGNENITDSQCTVSARLPVW